MRRMSASRSITRAVLSYSCRRRHTRCGRDWSSDVCSSDLTLLSSNATGFVPIDLSGSTTIAQDTLSVAVAKSRLGIITAWEIDATATETGAVYTYVDYGWRIPGNPGSAPKLPGAQFILPNAAWIALVPVVIAIAIVVVIVFKDRAERSSRKSSKAKAEPVSFHHRGKP